MTADQKSGEVPGRRKFLSLTTSDAASTWPGAGLFAAGASAAPGPNDTINLGIIGNLGIMRTPRGVARQLGNRYPGGVPYEKQKES